MSKRYFMLAWLVLVALAVSGCCCCFTPDRSVYAPPATERPTVTRVPVIVPTPVNVTAVPSPIIVPGPTQPIIVPTIAPVVTPA
jgi:hypothetical protein